MLEGGSDRQLDQVRGVGLCVPGVSSAEAHQRGTKTTLDSSLACRESNLPDRDPWDLNKST